MALCDKEKGEERGGTPLHVLSMGKLQELQLHVADGEVKEEKSGEYENSKKLGSHEPRNFKWWISIIILHYTQQPSAVLLALVYFSFGICLAAYTLMYSIGLLHLPVSTFSLVCASQLAFNALFSFFLHSQKFTPFILNSLVLLTISSTLLIFQTNPASHTQVSKEKYAIGFVCTIGASAGYGLMLSLTQKLLKGETRAKVFEIVIYQSLVATLVAIVGLFTSGDWKCLSTEMAEFELGEFSYVMTLMETAIASQFFVLGAIGLIFEVSSLFSNAISVLGLPVIPILAVVFFHDKMDAVKVIAMVLAIWGFVSYVYQCYLDNNSCKNEYQSGSEGLQESST
ncbi:hypothetical protein GQ457_15G014280 [Hibiscus cannabinus]